MTIPVVLILMGAFLVITEVIIGVETGFDLLLLGASLMIGGVIGYYTGNYVGIGTAAVLCTSYVVLGRKYIKNKVHAYTHTSNVDTLLGKNLTIKTFDNTTKIGLANYKGEDWRIISDSELGENQEVKVISIDGVSLIVAPIKN